MLEELANLFKSPRTEWDFVGAGASLSIFQSFNALIGEFKPRDGETDRNVTLIASSSQGSSFGNVKN